MTVDFHTHIFPDKIAAGAVASLAREGGIPPHTDGTRAGLLSALAEAGVDVAVNLPVLTEARQFEGVLRFATALNADFAAAGRGILSFAGAHPAMPDLRASLRRVREAGILGIKIHPEYQDTFIDSDDFYALLAAAKEEGLITVTHAGVDIAYRHREPRATPARIARVLDRLGGYPTLVLAHLGGAEMLPEVMAHLAGREVYLDTAFVLGDVGRDGLASLLSHHGAERILFGTDSPWRNIGAELAHLRSAGLDPAALAAVLSGNARRLLGI
jgi:predicted TIM-barrel fold metal-dependent hydrolase